MEDTKKMQATTATMKPNGFGIRHIQYLLLITLTVIAYGMRTILNVSIVAMIKEAPEGVHYETYPEWLSKKNIILSSFFWGYICLQVGVGQLIRKYGVKRFIAIGIFTASLFSLLLPVFGHCFGYQGVVFCRIIQGLNQGLLLPSIHTLLSNWAPISERARWGGVVYSGQAVGNVIAMPISGFIADTSLGWPLIFYLYGGLGILWTAFWIFFGSDSPSSDKRITVDEKNWIECERVVELGDEKTPTPWAAIFTSLPFLALVVTHCGQNWGYWTLLTEMPSYMEMVLKFDIKSNSVLSALPYLVTWMLNFLFSIIADLVVERKTVSLTTSRKIFNSIGFYIPAIALITLTFVGTSNTSIIIVILVIAVGFNAGQYSGFNVNHIDLSPTHAGTLMAITNTSATVFSLLAPLSVDAVSNLTEVPETEERLWNIIFYIASAVYIITGTIFNIFGSGQVQSWDNIDVRDKEKMKAINRIKKISVISVKYD